MPTSAREKSEGSVGFYVDDNGKKQDDFIHEEILNEGDHEAALAVSRAVARRLGLDPNVVKTYRFRAADWDESLHPRDEHGRFGHGGGGSEGGSGKQPAAPKPKEPAEIAGLPKHIKITDRQLSLALARGDTFTFSAKERPRGKFESEGPYYTVTVAAKIPPGIKSYERREGRTEYYDPKLAEVHTIDAGTIIEWKLAKPKAGLETDIEPLPGKDIIYRGIPYKSYQRFLETGKIESRGFGNFGTQEGLTYWATDPATAVAYANGFAPWAFKPTFEKPAYVVATRMPKEVRHVPGVGENEVGVARAIDKSEIVGVWRGDVYQHEPGTFDLKPSESGGDNYRVGRSTGVSSGVVWSRDELVGEAEAEGAAPLYYGVEELEGAEGDVSYFEDAGIHIPGNADVKEYLDQWNETIAIAPADFKEMFLGGQSATMTVSLLGDGQVEIDGHVLDANGRRVGDYQTEIDMNRGRAELGLLELQERAQGQGIAKKILQGHVEFFQANDIQSVDIHANIDVGGHAWARFGFAPSKSSWRQMQGWIYSKLSDLSGKGASDDEIEALTELAESDDPEAIWAIADSDYGKDLLLDSDWIGALDLKDKETMERFNAYVGRKTKQKA